MKAKTKTRTKKTASSRGSRRTKNSREPKTNIENRDLNEDEQDQITNIEKDDDLALPTQRDPQNPDFDVDAEEEREKRRKAEYLRPEEPMK